MEDVVRLANLIASGLKTAGMDADVAHSAGAARDLLIEGAYDAMVLDLGLPDQDGLDFLADVRAQGMTLPVLILTTRIAVDDRVSGLNAGADDYLTKPFANEELEARLRALLRRPARAIQDVLRVGNLSFDSISRTVEVDGAPVTLTPREQTLLEQLMRQKGQVVQKTFLEDNIYGTERDLTTNPLEVLVHRLRAKLRDIGAAVSIHTVRGVGYLLSATKDAKA